MSSSPAQPVATVQISDPSNLTIRTIEYSKRLESYRDFEKPEVVAITDFKVDREIISTISLYFRKLVRTEHFSEAEKTFLELHEVKSFALEIILRNFLPKDEVPTSHLDLDLCNVWELLATADKFDIEPTSLKVWFGKWYMINGVELTSALDSARAMLYPCYAFNHAHGFAAASKYVVYRSVNHATEKCPLEHRHLHLPSRVIQQLNAARGRLKTILHQGLYDPIDHILTAGCDCKEETIFDYQKALQRTGSWPLEQHLHKISMETTLTRLNQFPQFYSMQITTRDREKHVHTSPETGASDENKLPGVAVGKQAQDCKCSRVSEGGVKQASMKTQRYFDGLCLDCMNYSKSETTDEDYWRHYRLRDGEWDEDCRIDHGEPTWYFSFMGRPDRKLAKMPRRHASD